MKLNRNNTNFPVQLFEYFKNAQWDTKYSFLKYYQNLVRAYVTDVSVDTRGLLIIHEMGLGKSILSIAIAMDLMPREPLLLMAKSLQGNMTNSIKQYIRMRTVVEPDYPLGSLPEADLDAWIKRNFAFVSMNASNMLSQVNRATDSSSEFDEVLDRKMGELVRMGSLDGKTLIVDEAHNFFRAITNGSKNAIGLYDMIRRARDLKVFFLTGTPIANDPFELAVCFNMLSKEVLLPESYTEFNKLYVHGQTIINRGKFQNRLFGLVSYVGNKSTPGAAFGVDGESARAEFPEELPMIIEYVNMDPDQYVMYQLARDKEREESNRRTGVYGGPKHGNVVAAPLTKPKSSASSTYRVKSRQLGNFSPIGVDINTIPVGDLGSAKWRAILANVDKHPNTIGLVYSQFVGVGGLATFAAYLKSQGWKQWEYTGTTKHGGSLELSLSLSAGYDPEIAHSGPELPSVNAFFENIAAQADLYTGGWAVDDLDAGHGELYFEGSWAVDDLDASYGELYFEGSGDNTNSTPRVSMANREGCESCEERIHANALKVLYSPSSKFPNYVLDIYDGDIRVGSATINYSRDNGVLTNGKVTKVIMSAGRISPEVVNAALVRVLERYNGGSDTDTNPNTIIDTSMADPRLVPDRERVFALITGEVDVEVRNAIAAAHNADSNKHGGDIDLLLVSSTGAEGLDLKNGRHIHMAEPYWDYGRLAQIIARYVRNNSHIALPPDERNVQPYLYLAVPPKTEMLSDGTYPPTTDVELYTEALNDQVLIAAFNEALHEVSIECMVNACKNCRVCNPTNSRLFTNDPLRDVSTADPCTQLEQHEVTAAVVELDGVKYYYTENPASLYNYKVFVYDADINGYRPMSEADPKYAIIAQMISDM